MRCNIVDVPQDTTFRMLSPGDVFREVSNSNTYMKVEYDSGCVALSVGPVNCVRLSDGHLCHRTAETRVIPRPDVILVKQ